MSFEPIKPPPPKPIQRTVMVPKGLSRREAEARSIALLLKLLEAEKRGEVTIYESTPDSNGWRQRTEVWK